MLNLRFKFESHASFPLLFVVFSFGTSYDVSLLISLSLYIRISRAHFVPTSCVSFVHFTFDLCVEPWFRGFAFGFLNLALKKMYARA